MYETWRRRKGGENEIKIKKSEKKKRGGKSVVCYEVRLLDNANLYPCVVYLHEPRGCELLPPNKLLNCLTLIARVLDSHWKVWKNKYLREFSSR